MRMKLHIELLAHCVRGTCRLDAYRLLILEQTWKLNISGCTCTGLYCRYFLAMFQQFLADKQDFIPDLNLRPVPEEYPGWFILYQVLSKSESICYPTV